MSDNLLLVTWSNISWGSSLLNKQIIGYPVFSLFARNNSNDLWRLLDMVIIFLFICLYHNAYLIKLVFPYL